MKISEKIVPIKVGDDLVLLSDDGTAVVLNADAALVFNRIESESDIKKVSQSILDQLKEENKQEVLKAVILFIKKLASTEYLELSKGDLQWINAL